MKLGAVASAARVTSEQAGRSQKPALRRSSRDQDYGRDWFTFDTVHRVRARGKYPPRVPTCSCQHGASGVEHARLRGSGLIGSPGEGHLGG